MKLGYTKWDHYRWSYVDRETIRTPNDVTPDRVHYRSWFEGGLVRNWESFRTECLSTANLIYEMASERNKPIRVMLSGGIDSEVVAWSFKLAGVPFTPTFLRFHDGLNDHEFEIAVQVATSLGVQLEVIDVDIHKIIHWANEEESLCRYNAPISYAHRWLAKSFPNDIAVWGCGDMVMNRDRDGSVYVELGAGRHHCYDIYTGGLPYLGIEQFLCYTPEQTVAAYANPIIQQWVTSPRSMPFPFYSIKNVFYKSEFPEIKTDREKRTGAEYIRVLECKFVDARKHLAPYVFRPQVPYMTVLGQLMKRGSSGPSSTEPFYTGHSIPEEQSPFSDSI